MATLQQEPMQYQYSTTYYAQGGSQVARVTTARNQADRMPHLFATMSKTRGYAGPCLRTMCKGCRPRELRMYNKITSIKHTLYSAARQAPRIHKQGLRKAAAKEVTEWSEAVLGLQFSDQESAIHAEQDGTR